MHRRHHELSGHEGDLHSPNLHGDGFMGRQRGFVHAHLTWMIEFDPGFLFIRLLETLGLVWDVKVPTPEKIARRMLRPAEGAEPDLETG
jgi:fatty-acid desaturase